MAKMSLSLNWYLENERFSTFSTVHFLLFFNSHVSNEQFTANCYWFVLHQTSWYQYSLYYMAYNIGSGDGENHFTLECVENNFDPFLELKNGSNWFPLHHQSGPILRLVPFSSKYFPPVEIQITCVESGLTLENHRVPWLLKFFLFWERGFSLKFVYFIQFLNRIFLNYFSFSYAQQMSSGG